MNDISINSAYTKGGKEIRIKNGTIISAGSIVQIGAEYKTFDCAYMVKIVSSWNDLCQAKEFSTSLVKI
jgi:hypothetical protein